MRIYHLGGKDKAVPFLLKALQYGDNSVLYTLAVLHLNEPDYAIRYMEKYMEAFPNDKKAARILKGLYIDELKKHKEDLKKAQ